MGGRIDWGYDAGRLGTISFTLTETGGGGASGSVSLTGQYTHVAALTYVERTDALTGEIEVMDLGYGLLSAALAAAMNAVGSATYSVTFDETTLAYTITETGGSVTAFAISSLSTAATRVLGLTASSGALTYTGSAVWHHTRVAVGGFSEWTEAEAEAESVDLMGADGSVRGLSPVGIARTLDFVAPWEARDDIWTAVGSSDWTWARAFARCRSAEPVAVEDPGDAGAWVVGYLRADSVSLRPRLGSADYLSHASVPVGMYVVGRVSSAWTLDYADASFSRASEGSYLTGAPGTGASAFLAWASSDVLREEDRGDGAGALALLEGERTNQILRSQEIDNGAWTTAGTVTVTAGQDSPDSGTTAERLQAASGTNIRYQTLTPGSGYRSVSAWVRAASGTVDHYIYMYDGSAAYFVGENGISTTYRRLTRTQSLAAGAGNVGVCDGRTGGVVSAGARDAYVALVQLEAGKFASSAIRTTGATVTRSADTLTYTSGIPGALYTGRGGFSEVSPIFASSVLASGDVFWLLSIDGSDDGIRIRHTGTDVRIEAVAGGVVKASSASLAFSAHALLGTVRWDPGAGLVYVNGDAGSTGTAWTWTSGPIRIGGVYGGSDEAYARLGTLGSWS